VVARFIEGDTVAMTEVGGGIGQACVLARAAEGTKAVVTDTGVGLICEDQESGIS
jgi:NAD(P)-dependent dehydrogenase (short-subunit alcohol dehydrogenase family)